MKQTGIFNGRTLVPYVYGCYGYTRGGGATWHGGIDLVGPDAGIEATAYGNAAEYVSQHTAIQDAAQAAKILLGMEDV